MTLFCFKITLKNFNGEQLLKESFKDIDLVFYFNKRIIWKMNFCVDFLQA